jgi:hypothetical protein
MDFTGGIRRGIFLYTAHHERHAESATIVSPVVSNYRQQTGNAPITLHRSSVLTERKVAVSIKVPACISSEIESGDYREATVPNH